MCPVPLPHTTIETTEDASTQKVPPYKVVFLNDDVTTMEFVVKILISVFKKDTVTAVSLMLEVHQTGAAVVDILSLEEAELRQQQTHTLAHQAGYPLRCIIEPA
jgi:ATP-dependent Clp protease adaptor protein ClpS